MTFFKTHTDYLILRTHHCLVCLFPTLHDQVLFILGCANTRECGVDTVGGS